MSKPYETRTAELGPFRVRVELHYDEYSSITDYLGKFSDQPAGIAYDNKDDLLIDFDDYLDLDEIRESDEDAESAWVLQCETERAAKREEVERVLAGKRAYAQQYRDKGLPIPSPEYYEINLLESTLHDLKWADYPPRPIPEAEGRTEEGYRILPKPDDIRCWSFPWAGAGRSFRYFSLERTYRDTDGQRSADYIREAWQDVAQMIGYVREEWGFIGIVVEVTLAGVEVGEASLWGVDNQSDDYIEETVKELIEQAMSEARKNIDKGITEASNVLAIFNRYAGIGRDEMKEEWEREIAAYMETAEWETN